jgi:hypothetical protein
MDLMEKFNEKEKKRKFNESLMKQVRDKEQVTKKENEVENSLIKRHFDYVKTIDDREKLTKEEKTKKIKEETKKMMSLSLGKFKFI